MNNGLCVCYHVKCVIFQPRNAFGSRVLRGNTAGELTALPDPSLAGIRGETRREEGARDGRSGRKRKGRGIEKGRRGKFGPPPRNPACATVRDNYYVNMRLS